MTIASWMGMSGTGNGDVTALIVLIGIPAMIILLALFNRPKKR